MKPIYLDHNTATRPIKVAHATIWQALDAPYADREVVSRLENEMQVIGGVVKNAGEIEIVSSGDEAVASVFYHHFFEDVKVSGRHHILYAESEKASVMRMVARLKELGCVAIPVPLDAGMVSVESLKKVVNPRVSFLSLPWVDPLTGVINPIDEIAAFCSDNNITLHLDVTYGIKYLDFDFCGDFATIDGRLIGSACGGGVIVKKERGAIGIVPRGKIDAGIVSGLAAAVEKMNEEKLEVGMEVARLRSHFEYRLKKVIPECIIHHAECMRAPATVAVSFPYVKNELLLFYMVQGGLFATMGGGQIRRLDEMSLSFTLNEETSEDELDRAVQMIAGMLQKLLPLCEVEA